MENSTKQKGNLDFHLLFGELRTIEVADETERKPYGKKKADDQQPVQQPAKMERKVSIRVETQYNVFEYSASVGEDHYAVIDRWLELDRGDRVCVVMQNMGTSYQDKGGGKQQERRWAMFRDLLPELEGLNILIHQANTYTEKKQAQYKAAA